MTGDGVFHCKRMSFITDYICSTRQYTQFVSARAEGDFKQKADRHKQGWEDEVIFENVRISFLQFLPPSSSLP